MVMQWQRDLPEAQGSVRVQTEQVKELWRSSPFLCRNGAQPYEVVVTVEWCDRCKNGSNTFYYREAVVWEGTNRESDFVSIGDDCAQPALSAIPPEIKALKKWNGCHPFGPWYYIENTLHHASDKDCHGLRKGESKQILSGGKTPAWKLVAIDAAGTEHELYAVDRHAEGEVKPDCPYTIEYRPWCRIGEGKARELEIARSTAIWPEATDDQLLDENLATALKMRLPGLLVEFRKVIESLGFVW